MKVTLLILFLAITTPAQTIKKSDFFRPYSGVGSITSSAVCVGSSISDIVSSQGLQEQNRFFRNSRGQLSTGRALLTIAPCGISYAFEKRHPKAATLFRFAFGVVRAGFAIHNWRQK